MDIALLVAKAAANRASDLHIVRGLSPRFRIDGSLEDLGDPVLTAEDCAAIALQLAGDKAKDIDPMGELDLAADFEGTRTRISLFRQQGAFSATLRLLSDHIPALDSLGLPPAVTAFPKLNNGLVLVTGETGSGKSTTLAALLQEINQTRQAHIITLEDPIEYRYTPDKCVINQREIGSDTASYANGLRAILREDPDVILIGEMRDLETIEIALTAAETGHLVFATLHTKSAADSVDRIVDVFPGERQHQIRTQLASCLQAVLSQQLLRRKGGRGRVCACELMVVNAAIRNLIREGKTPQIANALATSANIGSITMDNALINLCRARAIGAEVARARAVDPDYVRKNTTI